MKSLKDLSNYELLKWYDNSIYEELRKHPSIYNKSDEMYRPYHDYWNLYAYGDVLKCVYIKSSAKPKKPTEGEIKNKISVSTSCADEEKRFSQSITRTKSRVFEIAMCNEFQYFCTFTLDKAKHNRNDLKTFVKELSMMIRNINRSKVDNNKIQYLLIPEPHKDGAWHLHGLLSGIGDDLTEFKLTDNIPLKFKKMIKNGEKVYNWGKYATKFGFFTATKIHSGEACSKYITKYITKDLTHSAHEAGAHLFYASQGLKRRETIVKNCVDNCFVSDWDFENDYIKIKEFTVPKNGQ